MNTVMDHFLLLFSRFSSLQHGFSIITAFSRVADDPALLVNNEKNYNQK